MAYRSAMVSRIPRPLSPAPAAVNCLKLPKTISPAVFTALFRAFKSVQGPPIFFEKGEGCHLLDVDGQEFVDFCCSWGPLILSHCPPAVVQRVQETVARGMSFGTPTPHDNLIGKLMLDHHRYIEMVRLL